MRYTSIRVGFQGGEISPQFEQRLDHTKYQGSCRIVENAYVVPEGSVYRRPGTQFWIKAKYENSNYKLVIIPFEFSPSQSYYLIFGHQYVWFATPDGIITSGSVPLEVATPYSADDVASLRWAQSADVLYLTHERYPPAKLIRKSHTSWEYRTVVLEPPPTEEVKLSPNTTLTPGATSGQGITFTAGASVFLDGDKGKRITYGTSLAVIMSVTSGTQVTCDIIYDFPSTSPIPAGSWKMTGNSDAKLYLDTGRRNAIATVQSTLSVFRSEDVGRYLYISDGMGRITAYISATKVKMRVLKKITGVTNPATDNPTRFADWSLEEPAWDSSKGYPRCVTFYEQRLVFASSTSAPSAIWFSVTGDYENFSRGEADSDSMTFLLVANDLQTFHWLHSEKALIAGSMSGEWRISSSSLALEALSPTNVMARQETNYGSHDSPPVKVDQAVVFIQRGRRYLRELTYSFESDSLVAPDLLRLARHLADLLPSSVSLIRSPEPMIVVTTEDGTLLVATYTRPENVVAWARWTLSGKVLAARCVYNSDGTSGLLLAVQRTISGNTVVHIEKLAPFSQTDQNLWIYCDAALTYSGSPVSTLTGLGHLEGQTVQVWTGAPHPDRVVSSGQITLQSASSYAVVGLKQTTRVQTVRCAGMETASLAGLPTRGYRLDIDLLRSFNLQFGVDFDRMEQIGASNTLVSGRKDGILVPGGWNPEVRLCLKASDNAPMEVLGFFLRLQTTGSDGEQQ